MPHGDQKRNLVICRVGDGSLHRQWMGDPARRSFDLWLDYYGDDDQRYAGDPVQLSIGRGTTKWPRMAALLEARRDELARYDAVWFPDDDLAIDAAGVDRLFEVFQACQLWLAQPSLAEGSFFSYPMLMQNRSFLLRHTNFVEVMAPLFSREALAACRSSFTESRSGWGLDAIWPTILKAPPGKIGVIDMVAVLHTKPVGGGAWVAGLAESPQAEMERILAARGIPLPLSVKQQAGVVLGPPMALVKGHDPTFLPRVVGGTVPSVLKDPFLTALLLATLPKVEPSPIATVAAPRPAGLGTPPAVSVVIPCYQQAEYLPFAVGSVALQAYRDWEVVIVDDGSPDDTSAVGADLAAQLGADRVRVIRQANAGLAEARNAGIRAARGRYILPLDADDALDHSFLAKAVSYLEATGADVVGSDMLVFGARQGIIRVDPRAGLERLLQGNCLNYCSLYRREVWAAVGGYNPNMTAGYEDWDFWVGCAERGVRFAYLPEPIFYYREKEASMLTSARRHDPSLRARLMLNHPACHASEALAAAERQLRDHPLPPMKGPRAAAPAMAV